MQVVIDDHPLGCGTVRIVAPLCRLDLAMRRRLRAKAAKAVGGPVQFIRLRQVDSTHFVATFGPADGYRIDWRPGFVWYARRGREVIGTGPQAAWRRAHDRIQELRRGRSE